MCQFWQYFEQKSEFQAKIKEKNYCSISSVGGPTYLVILEDLLCIFTPTFWKCLSWYKVE